ncbi:MAG: exonuclease domain-containing protein [Victivallaceae bacterium]|nr:exonuclease domain-containing protein [Victivallaceae bacterium]
MNFVAIDFEYAVGQDTACSVGIVTVEGGEIIDEYCQLIQPPGNYYSYWTTMVHGLNKYDTAHAPLFPKIYPEIKRRLSGKTVVAHNIGTDRSVLYKNMTRYRINHDDMNIERWECTLQIYRRKGHKPCGLDVLCKHFNIELNHHEALSDARACAKLYLFSK